MSDAHPDEKPRGEGREARRRRPMGKGHCRTGSDDRERERLRLFVGIRPPPEMVLALFRSVSWKEVPAHRRTDDGQVHLTVLFLGEVPGRELRDIIASTDRAAAGAHRFELVPQRLVTLPVRGDRRTLAVVTSAPPDLLDLRARLVRRLVREPRPDPNDRFLPHFTLARFSPPAPELSVPRDRELEAMPSIPVSELHLIQSRLRPWGAVHTVLASFPLG